jgi:probable F420-dependent oxidoreductase
VRFSVALLPDHHELLDPASLPGIITERARAAEAAGYAAAFVTDHPAPDTRWLAGGGHHALEPTVALAFAAGVTQALRLHTHIYVLAYRNPFLAARALSSLALVSGDRLIVGIAAGYLRPEFAAAGVPFDERNERLDRSLDVVRRLCAGEVVAGDGPGWTAKGVQHLPAPVTPPTVWIGGNSTAAMRRAVAADGWSPFPTPKGLSGPTKTAEISDLDTLAQRIDRFRQMCADADRPADLDICMAAFSTVSYLAGKTSAEHVLDEYGTLAELGVTWATVGFPGGPAESLEGIERFAEEVVAPLSTT